MASLNPGGQRVFWISALIVLALVIVGASFPERFSAAADTALSEVARLFSWFYLLSVFGFVICLLALALSRYGKIRLGPQDSTPSYSFFSWASMLLAAGFGVGLVFYGLAEPMSHYLEPPYGDRQAETQAAARYAIQYSYFNWGVHQWAAFSVVGLIIAYFQFRKGQAGLVSSVMSSMTAKHPHTRRYAPVLDIFAVVATVIGMATSLGLGVLQVNSGLSAVFGLSEGVRWQAAILLAMFLAYLTSTWLGLDRGIKRLSNFNLILCIGLVIYVLIAGPTVMILETITLGLGDYLQNFLGMSLRISPYTDNAWASEWTVFYWAWVIAWSPFVGTFVARVSRGRTIREYVMGVLIVPPLLACLWIGVLGGAALNMEQTGDVGLAAATQDNIPMALFEFFNLMPFTTVLSVIAMCLIFVFLVTSADSASYIVAQMTDSGAINPRLYKRLIWGGLIAAISLMLIFAGGLEGLQSAVVVAALPFTFILYGMVFVLIRELRADRQAMLTELYRRHETPVGADAFEAERLGEEDRLRRAPAVKRRISRRDT